MSLFSENNYHGNKTLNLQSTLSQSRTNKVMPYASGRGLIMSHNSVLDTGNDLNMSLLMELSMLQAKNFYKYYTPVGIE